VCQGFVEQLRCPVKQELSSHTTEILLINLLFLTVLSSAGIGLIFTRSWEYWPKLANQMGYLMTRHQMWLGRWAAWDRV